MTRTQVYLCTCATIWTCKCCWPSSVEMCSFCHICDRKAHTPESTTQLGMAHSYITVPSTPWYLSELMRPPKHVYIVFIYVGFRLPVLTDRNYYLTICPVGPFIAACKCLMAEMVIMRLLAAINRRQSYTECPHICYLLGALELHRQFCDSQ